MPDLGALLSVTASDLVDSYADRTRAADNPVALKSAIHSRISIPETSPKCRSPNRGRTCTRSNDSYPAAVFGFRSVLDSSHRIAHGPNGIRPRCGSTHVPRTLSTSIAAQNR